MGIEKQLRKEILAIMDLASANHKNSIMNIFLKYLIVYSTIILFTFCKKGGGTIDPNISGASVTYYVSTIGNDNNTLEQAKNPDTPWKTIKKAASIAGSGDIVLVRNGVYIEEVRLRNFGTENQPITFKAYPGENPVIDLNGRFPATEGGVEGWWFGVISMLGDYNIVDGFEIRNGKSAVKGSGGGQGVEINGNHNIVRNCVIYNIQDAGIRIRGNYSTVEGNQIYDACLFNINGSNATGGAWGSGISIAGLNNGTILSGNVIRNNKVHNIWGEGIYGYYGISNTLMEGNVVYDTYALGIGLSGSANGIIRNNLVYKSTDGLGGWGGIVVANDNNSKIQDICNNNLVYNNFVYGSSIEIQRYLASATSQIIDTRIYYNTVINPNGDPLIMGGTQINTTIRNNIFFGSWSKPLYASPKVNGNNYWRATPGTDFNLSSPTDIIGDASAYLVKSSGKPAAGQLTRDWFKLTSDSPARSHGVPLPEVKTDAFGSNRDPVNPDIGAHEY